MSHGEQVICCVVIGVAAAAAAASRWFLLDGRAKRVVASQPLLAQTLLYHARMVTVTDNHQL